MENKKQKRRASVFILTTGKPIAVTAKKLRKTQLGWHQFSSFASDGDSIETTALEPRLHFVVEEAILRSTKLKRTGRVGMSLNGNRDSIDGNSDFLAWYTEVCQAFGRKINRSVPARIALSGSFDEHGTVLSISGVQKKISNRSDLPCAFLVPANDKEKLKEDFGTTNIKWFSSLDDFDKWFFTRPTHVGIWAFGSAMLVLFFAALLSYWYGWGKQEELRRENEKAMLATEKAFLGTNMAENGEWQLATKYFVDAFRLRPNWVNRIKLAWALAHPVLEVEDTFSWPFFCSELAYNSRNFNYVCVGDEFPLEHRPEDWGKIVLDCDKSRDIVATRRRKKDANVIWSMPSPSCSSAVRSIGISPSARYVLFRQLKSNDGDLPYVLVNTETGASIVFGNIRDPNSVLAGWRSRPEEICTLQQNGDMLFWDTNGTLKKTVAYGETLGTALKKSRPRRRHTDTRELFDCKYFYTGRRILELKDDGSIGEFSLRHIPAPDSGKIKLLPPTKEHGRPLPALFCIGRSDFYCNMTAIFGLTSSSDTAVTDSTWKAKIPRAFFPGGLQSLARVPVNRDNIWAINTNDQVLSLWYGDTIGGVVVPEYRISKIRPRKFESMKLFPIKRKGVFGLYTIQPSDGERPPFTLTTVVRFENVLGMRAGERRDEGFVKLSSDGEALCGTIKRSKSGICIRCRPKLVHRHQASCLPEIVNMSQRESIVLADFPAKATHNYIRARFEPNKNQAFYLIIQAFNPRGLNAKAPVVRLDLSILTDDITTIMSRKEINNALRAFETREQ